MVSSEISSIKEILTVINSAATGRKGGTKKHEFWFDHFHLEFAAHILSVNSIHEYYLLVDYERITPTASA